jgi:hypothetical protein
MLEALTGIEFGSTSKLIIGLILVLVLIAISAWLLKRFGTSRIATQGGRGRQQRLAVLDSAAVDARRRLVLIRRDNVEHLILIGGPSDVVVEPNIVRAQPASGARVATRQAGYEDEETSLIPDAAFAEPEPRPTPAPAPAARVQHGPSEPPRTMPRPAQKLDPQYADMAQRLEAALRKPGAEPEVTRQAPAPRVHEPRPAQPAPEPRVMETRPAQPAPAPRAPMPRIPEPHPEPRVETPRAPEPRLQPAPGPQPQPAHAAPGDQAAADVFSSLEEEMASLLRPGGKKDPKK